MNFEIIRNEKEFGVVVRQARQNKNLRQVDVARRARIRQALVSDIENGVTTAKLSTIINILDVVGLDLTAVPRTKEITDSFDHLL